MGRARKKTATYVYGVVRANGSSALRVRGIARKQVRVVHADGLGALTTDVPPGDLAAGRDELTAHSRVLERALEQGTVLPMRFGVVLPSESAVREQLLDPHRDELESQLAEMEGKVEINVKAIYDEGALLTEVVSENSDIARLREGLRGRPEDATYYDRIRLGELIAGAVDEKRDQDAAAILDRLTPLVAAVQVGDPVHERMVLNASILVDRSALKEFDSELDRIAEEQGGRMRFKYTGPLAPHSFVELAMEG